MKVAIYTRVSTEDQAREGYSLSVQEDFLIDFAHKHGYEIYSHDSKKIYQDDGYSGYSLDRPALRKLLEDAKAKKFDLVIVYKLDRFSRRLKDLLNVFDELESLGIQFKSATEPYDTTTSSGKLMLQQLGSFAEFERNRIIERVFPGMVRGVQAGHWQGARYAPYGYRYNKVSKRLELVREEADYVKEIFTKYLAGMSTQKIAGELYKKEIRTRSGGLFNSSLVRRILRNKIYLGRLVWNVHFYDHTQKTRSGFRYVKNDPSKIIEAKGNHKPLISESDFNRAQKLLDQNRRGSFIRQRKFNYPFSGLLICAKCGSAYMGAANVKNHRTGEKRRFYRCTGRALQNIKCGNGDVRAEIIEAQVFEVLDLIFCEEVIDFERLKSLLIDKNKNTVKQNEKKKLGQLKLDLQKCSKKFSKLTDAYIEGIISKEIFQEKCQKLKNEEGEIRIHIERQELQLIRKEESKEYLKRIDETLGHIPSIEEDLDPITQREFMRLIFKRLLILDRRLKDFVLFEPFNTIYEYILDTKANAIERRKIDWTQVMNKGFLRNQENQSCLLSHTDDRWTKIGMVWLPSLMNAYAIT